MKKKDGLLQYESNNTKGPSSEASGSPYNEKKKL